MKLINNKSHQIDFNLRTYRILIETLIAKNFQFLTVEQYFLPPRFLTKSPSRSLIIMRHDVDRKPENALRMAILENKLGVKSTYYFRTIPQTLKPGIIREVASLGHEIGYHYENLCDAEIFMKNENPVKYSRSSNFTGQECNPPSSQFLGLRRTRMKNTEKYKEKLFDLAIRDFEKNLSKLREIVPIKNIAMHGRPTSKWDSRLLWDKYNYKNYGITSEPYFDIDFNEVLYITDAGRSWNNENINLRDKVVSKFNFSFNHTEEIISAISQNKLPDKIMINIHPEHWAGLVNEWYKIWIMRKIKNTIKNIILRGRS